MNTLEQLLAGLSDVLPEDLDGRGEALRCDGVRFEMPLESLLDRRVGLRATVPRARLATGFELPLGRIVVRYQRST